MGNRRSVFGEERKHRISIARGVNRTALLHSEAARTASRAALGDDTEQLDVPNAETGERIVQEFQNLHGTRNVQRKHSLKNSFNLTADDDNNIPTQPIVENTTPTTDTHTDVARSQQHLNLSPSHDGCAQLAQPIFSDRRWFTDPHRPHGETTCE